MKTEWVQKKLSEWRGFQHSVRLRRFAYSSLFNVYIVCVQACVCVLCVYVWRVPNLLVIIAVETATTIPLLPATAIITDATHTHRQGMAWDMVRWYGFCVRRLISKAVSADRYVYIELFIVSFAKRQHFDKTWSCPMPASFYGRAKTQIHEREEKITRRLTCAVCVCVFMPLLWRFRSSFFPHIFRLVVLVW